MTSTNDSQNDAPENTVSAGNNLAVVSKTGTQLTLQQKLDKAADEAEGTRAKQTERTYAAGIKNYVLWCDEIITEETITKGMVLRGKAIGQRNAEYGFPESAIDPEDLAEFINARSKKLKPATVEKYVSAINGMHFDADIMPLPAQARIVKLALTRMRRRYGVRQKQAVAMREPAIKKAVAAMGNSLPDLRDTALLWIAYTTMARASELVDFKVGDLSENIVDDAVEFNENEEYSINIRFSKSDQEGQGSDRHVSTAGRKAIMRYLNAMHLDPFHDADEPLFSPISNGAMADKLWPIDISRIYKKRVGKQYTAHSTRVGAAIDQLAANQTTAKIMQAGGWSTPGMVAKYTRMADTANSAAAELARIQGHTTRRKAAPVQEEQTYDF